MRHAFHDPTIAALARLAEHLHATMSDPGAGGGTPPAAPPAATPPAAPPATPPADADAGLAALPDSWQKEIRDLRAEAAANRTGYKPYKDTFDGLSDDDRGAILDFVKAYKADPAQAGQIATQWGQALTPAQRGAVADAAGAAPTDAPMTRAEFTAAMEARDAQAGTQSAVAEMQREARDLGYDPNGPEYLLLIQAMDRLGTTDMRQGHAEVEKFLQGKVDAYVAAKAGDAAGSPLAPSGGGAPAPAANRPTDFAAIKAGAAEFLANLK